MFQTTLPRRWFAVIIGLANWKEKAHNVPYKDYHELQEIIDNFISRTYKEFRKRGAIVGSLLWSHENLAPMFLLEATKTNENFLKEQRAIFNNVTERIYSTLTVEEKQSALGKNLMTVSPEGRTLFLECSIPFNAQLFPFDHQVISVFCDAFNAELLTIKRAEHDYSGRRNWLSTIESTLSRDYMRDIGPLKKLREVKEIEGKRLYEKKSPGDFEKIVRILNEASPFRQSLFELEKPQPNLGANEPLGHIIIQYLSTEGDFPIKITNRSTTHERIGRKLEDYEWVSKNNFDWKELDKLNYYAEEIVYDKVERLISDVGGIKFDAFWTEKDLSNNIFFLSKFSFTEDIMLKLKEFLSNPRALLEERVGSGTTVLFDLWQKAGLHFNLLVFEVKGLDQDEDRCLSEWVRKLKDKQIPGPNFIAEKDEIERRHFRPL